MTDDTIRGWSLHVGVDSLSLVILAARHSYLLLVTAEWSSLGRISSCEGRVGRVKGTGRNEGRAMREEWDELREGGGGGEGREWKRMKRRSDVEHLMSSHMDTKMLTLLVWPLTYWPLIKVNTMAYRCCACVSRHVRDVDDSKRPDAPDDHAATDAVNVISSSSSSSSSHGDRQWYLHVSRHQRPHWRRFSLLLKVLSLSCCDAVHKRGSPICRRNSFTIW